MIQIDYREHDLIQLITPLLINTTIEMNVLNLDIGDIIIGDRVIIERKTIADLNSSILDGRYDEQSYRLSNATKYHKHNIIYLIEGLLSSIKYDEPQQTRILSAIMSLHFYKGFTVMRTMSLSDTALYIVHYAKKMLKNLTKLGFFETPNLEVSSSSSSLSSAISSSSLSSLTDISDNPVVLVDETTNITQTTVDKQYIPFVKSVKKSNITENNIDEIMLCQIPGISSQIAKSIISHFGSLQNMFLQYSVEGESILSNILISRKNSSECKLNKTVIKNILKYLFKK
jgi:ERCC4-type nuclease